MTITPKTTVHTLLKEYPFLLEYLAAYHPEFGKLTNPVLRRTMGRMATLDTAARSPLKRLLKADSSSRSPCPTRRLTPALAERSPPEWSAARRHCCHGSS